MELASDREAGGQASLDERACDDKHLMTVQDCNGHRLAHPLATRLDERLDEGYEATGADVGVPELQHPGGYREVLAVERDVPSCSNVRRHLRAAARDNPVRSLASLMVSRACRPSPKASISASPFASPAICSGSSRTFPPVRYPNKEYIVIDASGKPGSACV